MAWKKFIFVFAVVLLNGCTPTIKRTDMLKTFNVPDAWTGGTALAGPSEADWWTYFGDPGMDDAISRSLSDNVELQVAAARVEAAIQDAKIAGGALWPGVDVSLLRSRARQNFIGFPIPGGEKQVLSTTSSNARLSFGLDYELDVWGRVRAGKLGAIATAEARQADLAAARLSLTARTAKAWFAAVEADRQVALAQATVRSYETSVERVRVRFETGLRPALDLRLSLTELERAKALLEQRIEQRERSIRQLEILLGRYPDGEHDLAADLPALPGPVPAGLPAELVNRRPDLVSAERTLLAADTRIHQSKADLKPRFALTSSAGNSSRALRDLLDSDLFVWNLIGNIAQPLFEGGRLRATVKKNEAQAWEAAANYEKLLLQAYCEVESALAAESVLARRENALTEATRQAIAARRLSEERYRLGLTDIITLLSSQRAALDSESSLLNIRRLRLDNRVDLHLAIGGGFDASQADFRSEDKQQKANKEKES